MYTDGSRVEEVLIEEELRVSYIDYAMSVIVARAIPDVRDGMKPVQRRILYAMHESGLAHNRPYKKSARIVGEVMGKYHPHGDAAIYDSLARMAQDFSMRYPLVDGQGNFGSVDGDPPGAQRYTEAKMSRLAGEILADIEKGTVDFVPNYDNLEREPVVLPAQVPSLLLNGATGIAVGMATNIPPHNMGEIVDALCLLIDSPDVALKELLKVVTGPDFPTGGIICGREGIRKAYMTGRGALTVRAKACVEHVQRGGERERVIVTEIPYMVNKARLIESIADLVRAKKIDGISDLRDESDKDGMRIVIELKKGANAQVLLNKLYHHSQMQVTFGAIMLALHDGRPKVMNLKEMLSAFIDHRNEVVVRRTRFDLVGAQERAHILEGLKTALDRLDEVISTIRSSSTAEEAKAGLTSKFGLSEIQAQAILDMRLQRLTGLERKKIDDEYLETIKLIAKLEAILASPRMVLEIIKEELRGLKERYGDARRTEIAPDSGDMDVEDMIAEEDMVITVSHAGYVKRLPVSTYRKQHRGGKGVMGAGTKSEDFIEDLFIASTHEYILIFTNKGRAHWLKVWEIPTAGRLSRGKAIVNLLSLAEGEGFAALARAKTFDEDRYVIFATEQGIVKRTPLSAFSHPRAGGILAINVDEGDFLIDALVSGEGDQVFLATRGGMAIRFKSSDVRPMGRAARGVKGIELAKGDKVVSLGVAPTEETTILTICENGYGKRTLLSDYRLQSRGGKGVINIRATERNGAVVAARAVTDQDGLMIITAGGKLIRSLVAPIRTIGRATQGVRLIRLDEGDSVGSVARLVARDEAEAPGEEVEGGPGEVEELEEGGEGAGEEQGDDVDG